MFNGVTDVLKDMEDKVIGLFEKKKTEAEIASEKAANAKKSADEQMQKTTDAISDAASEAKNKASDKVGEIEDSIGNAKDHAIEDSHTRVDLMKASAYNTFEKGLKAVENAFSHSEK